MIGRSDRSRRREFEREILPHLDAAFSLARFLLRNDEDAEDAVQESALRAFRFFDGFRGQNGRAWFLRIVRNTAFTLMQKEQPHEADVTFDEELHTPASPAVEAGAQIDLRHDQATVRSAIEQLAPEFREVVTLRELEDCSYKEIADVCGVPVGTVMSRLSRARAQLQQILSETYRKED